MMDKEIIEKINQSVFNQFPYLRETDPEITEQPSSVFLFVYNGIVETADGHAIPISVRVVTDSCGKILKMTSSR